MRYFMKKTLFIFLALYLFSFAQFDGFGEFGKFKDFTTTSTGVQAPNPGTLDVKYDSTTNFNSVAVAITYGSSSDVVGGKLEIQIASGGWQTISEYENTSTLADTLSLFSYPYSAKDDTTYFRWSVNNSTPTYSTYATDNIVPSTNYYNVRVIADTSRAVISNLMLDFRDVDGATSQGDSMRFSMAKVDTNTYGGDTLLVNVDSMNILVPQPSTTYVFARPYGLDWEGVWGTGSAISAPSDANTITFVGAETASGTGVDTLDVNVPAGVENGDILFAGTVSDASATLDLFASSGWTALDSSTASSSKTKWWWKIADNEPATYTFSREPGSPIGFAGIIVAFEKDAGTWDTANQSHNNNSALDASGITSNNITGTNPSMQIELFSSDDGASQGTVSGFTNAGFVNQGSCAIGVWYRSLSAAGNVNATWVATAGYDYSSLNTILEAE